MLTHNVSPYMTVTAERYTKHYFSNSQRIASKLGTGEFDNVYGVNNFHLTAGQKDYAERMVQIEESRQEYMMENGIPPGVPTQKGQNIEPEITGVALPNKPLGNYDVPNGWPTKPHFNEKGDVPGPPLQWEEPEDLSNVEAGYGYKSDNEEENDIFFFHSDHLGSTSYLTDKDGNACEYVCYMPYGESIVDENNTDFENLFKFTGKELDRETGLHYFGARYFDKYYGIWYGPDELREDAPMYSPYSFCYGNPVKYKDPDGKFPGVDRVIGAIVNGAIDYAGQVAGNLASGEKISDAFTDVSVGSIAVSMVEGAINPIGSISKSIAKSTTKTIVSTTIKEATSSAASQVIDNVIEGKEITDNVGTQAAIGGVVGNAKNFVPKTSEKSLNTIKELDVKIEKGKVLTNRQTERYIQAKTEKQSNELVKVTIDYTVNANKKMISNETEK